MRFRHVLAAATCAIGIATAEPQVVIVPGNTPVVNFRVVFRTGAADDGTGKAGLANLTASVMAQGGTRELTYKQVVDALFPMAASISRQVDKEMVTFSGTTHVDNLEQYYKLFRAAILEPGWRADDFTRVRDDLINHIRIELRQANDEELGKEALYQQIYRGTPYQNPNAGTVSGLQSITADDLKAFYKANFTRDNIIIGLAGRIPAGFADRVKADFAEHLPPGTNRSRVSVTPKVSEGRKMTLIDKQTRSVAYSLGFPLAVRRGHPDYPALLIINTYFGQHRMSMGRLYQRMRELRGLNYGDYSYMEYFPNGMFLFEPEPNLARTSQIFQVWIRPVEPQTAMFALRLALFEMENLFTDGLSEQDFQYARSYLLKNVNLLLKTKRAQLGYAIDSAFYGIPEYAQYLRDTVGKLTRDDVNAVIRKYLQTKNLQIVAVTANAEALKQKLVSGEASPMKYNSPKAKEVVDEDQIVERFPLNLDKPEVIKVDTVFQ